ncbi:MAG: molybdopterin molybdotransferase MoeA [Flavobacteriaceae bacterium]|nr:molybdopterin molybdotransferase MoeA [Flavobacteriaceae bacterium]
MITSKQALQIILENTIDFGIEQVPFMNSLGRTLKEDIVADRDFPPFNRVSMDGIAINYTEFQKGKRHFTIEGIQAAGSEQLYLRSDENCLEVMTGAMLPENTDSVIPYEQVIIEAGKAMVTVSAITQGQNVHKKGHDRKEGTLLLRSNTLISPAETGVLTTVGKAVVSVSGLPKVMIISTGDELVPVSEKPLPHQIRRSNVYTLTALLEQLKIKAETDHITDDKPLLKKKIEKYLNEFDVLLFSGAVSKGKFDYLPEVLDELGVKKMFHGVQQRPGKPFWFGVRDLREKSKTDKTVVFAFPGNPVSTFVGCLKYFYPWYRKSAWLDFQNRHSAILAEDFNFKPALTYFLQVKLKNENGKLMAYPIVGHGSGDLANLADADAFLELPDNRNEFKKDEVFPLIIYRM